jgi:hypothetical protein
VIRVALTGDQELVRTGFAALPAARDRAQLADFAYRAGLARPGWAG